MSQQWRRVDWNRILSLVVAAAWVALVAKTSGFSGAAKVLLFLVFPYVLIWRADLLGSSTETSPWRAWQGRPETDTAGCLVRVVGWALLCVPALATLLAVLHG